MYKKSFCNEEGQVAVDKGTFIEDRTCRCDYTKGYNYTKKPTNSCKCSPVKEDCSCYINTCSRMHIHLNQGLIFDFVYKRFA